MIRSICFSLLLIFGSSVNILAQDKPAFIAEIEKVFQEKEPGWKVERRNARGELSYFTQDTVFRSGRFQAAISITVWSKEKDAHDVFEGTAIAYGNINGGHKTRKSLPNLGDENYIWVNRHSNAWPEIQFRKGKVYVTVFAPSVAIAKRFAQHVAERIPAEL